MTAPADGGLRARAELTDRDVKWLTLAAGSHRGFPGVEWDSAPNRFSKLARLGLVQEWPPRNGALKPRAVATRAGRDMVGREAGRKISSGAAG